MCVLSLFYSNVCDGNFASGLCANLLVEQKFSQRTLSVHHLLQRGHHTGQFALSVVLFL